MKASPPSCACRRAQDHAAFERQTLRALASASPATERGRLRVDTRSLRRALGGRGELAEAMEAKASGRPGVNASVMWRYFTTSVYASGDLPVLAAREALQNGVLCAAPHKTPYAESVLMRSTAPGARLRARAEADPLSREAREHSA